MHTQNYPPHRRIAVTLLLAASAVMLLAAAGCSSGPPRPKEAPQIQSLRQQKGQDLTPPGKTGR